MNPSILTDFNILTGLKNLKQSSLIDPMPIYNGKISAVDNSWAGMPYVIKVTNQNDVRAAKAAREDHGDYIYLLKWRR